MEPGSARWYQAMGQEATDRSWNTGIPPEHNNELLYCVDEHTLEQLVQSRTGVSLTGAIQKLPGSNPDLPALGHSAWAGRLDLMTSNLILSILHSKAPEPRNWTVRWNQDCHRSITALCHGLELWGKHRCSTCKLVFKGKPEKPISKVYSAANSEETAVSCPHQTLHAAAEVLSCPEHKYWQQFQKNQSTNYPNMSSLQTIIMRYKLQPIWSQLFCDSVISYLRKHRLLTLFRDVSQSQAYSFSPCLQLLCL